jgi:hypothetical protein
MRVCVRVRRICGLKPSISAKSLAQHPFLSEFPAQGRPEGGEQPRLDLAPGQYTDPLVEIVC